MGRRQLSVRLGYVRLGYVRLGQLSVYIAIVNLSCVLTPERLMIDVWVTKYIANTIIYFDNTSDEEGIKWKYLRWFIWYII